MGVTVLVVDDEPVMCALISRMLTRFNCTTHEAHSGPEAEAMMEEIRPELVFMDIMMPEQDGYVTSKNLRAQGYKGRIVMITAMSPEAGLSRALEAGANDYTQKPVSRETLQKHVDAVVNDIVRSRTNNN